MKLRPIAMTLLLGLLLLPLGSAAAEDRGTRHSSVTNPFITGSFVDPAGGQGVFSGNMKLLPFEIQSGQVVAVGRLKGLLSDSSGEALGRVDQKVTWPLQSVEGTCQAIQLKFAGADMSVENVQVHFDSIVLDVTRESKSNRNIDEMLCSVSGLAKNASSSPDLREKLNDLFGALR